MKKERTINTTTYNYAKHISLAQKEAQYKDFSMFINDKIHEVREKYYDGEARLFNRSVIAERIGIETSTLTKIINGSQATRKRDLLIALCFTLNLSKDETNIALNLYPMAPLNPYNLRDLVIIQALGDRLSVSMLNEVLENHRFHRLQILRSQKKGESPEFYYPLESDTFEELSVSITPYLVAGNDCIKSLHDRYRPDQYDFHSEMVIQRKDSPTSRYRIILKYSCYEILKLEDNTWTCIYTSHPFDGDYNNIPPYLDPELLNEIAKLKEYTDRKARYIYNMCNDTRNYGVRFNAINHQNQLMIYGESFGFDCPEQCEYFQLEISSTSVLFTTSNSSLFLEKYLGPKQWGKLYGTSPQGVTHNFSSFDEITDERWKKQFTSLLDSAREFLNQIQTRKLFLFNARAYLDIDQLMHTFKVEEAFDCIEPDDLPYEIVPQRDHIIGPDGKPITVDDLYRAAELDIFTINDLCSIRDRYDSLEHFLNISMLKEQKGNSYGK